MVPGSAAYPILPVTQAITAYKIAVLATNPSSKKAKLKTIESIRKHKLVHWDANKETNRQWLGLNMLTEAQAGFRAFNEGTGRNREIDFGLLRQRLAAGERWGPELIEAVLPKGDA